MATGTGKAKPLSKAARAKARRNGRKAKAVRAKNPEMAVCGATKRNGDPCLRGSGWGTDHPGYGRCKWHSGSTEAGKTNAAKLEAQGMAQPIPVTPGQAVLGTLHLAAGQLAYATMKVAEQDSYVDEKTGLMNVWARIQQGCQDRVVKYAAAAASMGVQERQTQLMEQQALMMGRLIEAVVSDVGLTPAQKKKLGPALRKRLDTIDGGARQVETVA